MMERFKDVGIRRGVTTTDPSQHRHKQFHVTEINRAPQAVVRFAEIQHEQAPAGPGHALHFAEAGLMTRQVSQAVANRYNIEGPIGKWNLQRVAANESG